MKWGWRREGFSDRYGECREWRSRLRAGRRLCELLRLFEDKSHAGAGPVQKLRAGTEQASLLLLAKVLEVLVGAAPVALHGEAQGFEENGSAELGDHLGGQ